MKRNSKYLVVFYLLKYISFDTKEIIATEVSNNCNNFCTSMTPDQIILRCPAFASIHKFVKHKHNKRVVMLRE